MKPVC